MEGQNRTEALKDIERLTSAVDSLQQQLKRAEYVLSGVCDWHPASECRGDAGLEYHPTLFANLHKGHKGLYYIHAGKIAALLWRNK